MSEKEFAKVKGTLQKVLLLIKVNKSITTDELSEKIGVTKRTIHRNIKKLQDDKIIKRIGGDKGGYWEVIK